MPKVVEGLEFKVIEHKERPEFEAGLSVTVPAMIVDRNGVAWWVDPESRRIDRAA